MTTIKITWNRIHREGHLAYVSSYGPATVVSILTDGPDPLPETLFLV
jgi:hypothetical protein